MKTLPSQMTTRIFTSCLIGISSIAALVACSSAPKAAKNPGEEAALQEKAKQVISAGQTENAKAGGYDAIPFWQNRAAITKKYVNRSVENEIFSRSKKMYIMDFKVKFVRAYKLDEQGGLGFLDRMAESSKTTYGLNERRAYVGQVVLDDAAAQKITDDLLADFKKRMTALGYELVAREDLPYEDLKEYLVGKNMIASPQDGEHGVRIFAPTGWKLEKSTYDVLGVGAGFGDNLMKLGEQVSRKQDQGIAVAPTYYVTFGAGNGGKFMPYASIKANFSTSQKYTFGGFDMNEKAIQDAVPYKFTQEKKEVSENKTQKVLAGVTALMTQKSQEYSSLEVHEIKPDIAGFQARLMESAMHLNDIMEEHVRQGRDD